MALTDILTGVIINDRLEERRRRLEREARDRMDAAVTATLGQGHGYDIPTPDLSGVDPRLHEWAVGAVPEGTVERTPEPPRPTGGLRGLYGDMIPSAGGAPIPSTAIEDPYAVDPFAAEMGRSIGGGLVDTLRAAGRFQENYTPTGMVERAFGQPRPTETVPEVAQPVTPVGRMVRPMVPPLVSGGAAALGGGGLLGSMLLGGGADALLIPPEDPNVSSVIQEYMPNAITRALATNPDDPELLNRARNAIESMGLIGMIGGTAEGIGRAVRPRPEVLAEPPMSLSEMARIAARENPPLPPVRRVQPTIPATLDMPGMRAPSFAPDQPPMAPTTPRAPSIPEEHRGAGEYMEEVGEGLAPKAAAIEMEELGQGIRGEAEATVRGLDEITPETVLGEAAAPTLPEGGMDININFERINSTEEAQRVIQQVSDVMGGFPEARRGVVHDDALRGAARAMGMTPEQLRRATPQDLMTPERMMAARVVMVRSSERVRGIAQQYQQAIRDAGGDITRVPRNIRDEFRNALLQHAGMQEVVQGATAEAGRLLRQFSLIPEIEGMENLSSAFPGIKGMNPNQIDGALDNIADRLAHTPDPETAANMLGQARQIPKRERLFDAIYWIWINSILSGPETHMVNIGSNALTQGVDLFEHSVAAGIGAARRAVGGTTDSVRFREVAARVQGAWDGMRRSFRQAGRVMLGKEEGFNVAEEAKTSISREPIRMPDGSLIPLTPTRLLSAEDVFFRGTAESMEAMGLAYREGLNQGLRGQELTDFVQDYILNLHTAHPDVANRVAMRGRELTFTAPFESQSMRWFQSLIRDTNIGGFKPLRYVVPFIGTPTNLLKWAGRRTPLGVFARSFRKAWREGGAARDLAMARIVTGTGIMAGAYELWANGNITGAGPSDWNERQVLMRQGWQPYSIRVGDNWVSYRRFDPFAILLGQTTDFLEIMSEADFEDQSTWDNAFEVGGGLVAGASQAVQDKTWFRGVTEFVELASDPQRYGPSYLQGIGLGFIPNVSAQVGRQMDPHLRQTDTLMESIIERIPGQRTRLALRRDLWGRPITSRNVMTVSPVDVSEINPNPIDQELQRLNMAPNTPYHGYYPQYTSHEFSDYLRIRGSHAYEALTELISTPEYEALSDEDKRQAIDRTLSQASRFARERLVEETPRLLEAQRQETTQDWIGQGASEPLAAALVANDIGTSNMTVGNLPSDWGITLDPAQQTRHQQIWTDLMNQAFQEGAAEYEQLTPEQQRIFLRELGAGVRDLADQRMREELGLAPEPEPMAIEPVSQAPQEAVSEVSEVVASSPTPVTETPPAATETPSRPSFGDAIDFMGQTAQFYEVDLSTPVMQADIRRLTEDGASEFLAVSLTAMDYSPRYHTRSSPDLLPGEDTVAEQLFYQEYSRLLEDSRADMSGMTPEQQRRLMSSLASSARDAAYAVLLNRRNGQQ